jgi:UDP-N-acetylmuramoyl-tripeptide--D-alanyl-D-alanine ligase
MSIAELIIRRRQMPRWTAKALLTTILGCALAGISVYATFLFINACEDLECLSRMWTGSLLYAVLPLTASIFAFAGWIILLPLDRFLKQRILKQAKMLRASHKDLTVIGITGSVGKTTVKELLAHLLYERGAIATPAYVNSEMGVANWMLRELGNRNSPFSILHSQFLIVEMGAYRKGEIALLCSIAKPHYGVLTFIGPQHTALFGSLQAIADAKAELLESLPPLGKAFVNGDCDPCRDVSKRAGCAVVTIGTGGECDLEAFDVEESGAGIRFRVKDTVYNVPLNGSHNVANVLLAIAVALELKMKPEEIAAKLRTFTPLAKTFSVRTERGVRVLDDTHNASPMSFKAALAWAKSQPESPKILLTSGLMELGEEQPAIHRDLGAYAAGIVDRVIFLNKKNVQDFQQGYGENIDVLSSFIERVPRGSLLLCISRMPSSVIEKVLPA